jgi:hypothetical protein
LWGPPLPKQNSGPGRARRTPAPEAERAGKVKAKASFLLLPIYDVSMTEQLLGSDSFDLLPHLAALLIAYALAIPIGWNREREERVRACGPSRSLPSPPAG